MLNSIDERLVPIIFNKRNDGQRPMGQIILPFANPLADPKEAVAARRDFVRATRGTVTPAESGCLHACSRMAG